MVFGIFGSRGGESLEDTVIAEGASMEGTIRSATSVHLNGTFKGVVESEASVFVGDRGCVEGTIKAVDVHVRGEVRGDIYATGRVELESTARVFGDISTPVLGICGGAIFVGRSSMPGTAERGVPASPRLGGRSEVTLAEEDEL